MFAEMTPGSHHTLEISRKGIERTCCTLHRQQRPRFEKVCHLPGSKTKEQKHIKSPRLKSCLKFCFKDRTRMEQREMPVDPHTEGYEGKLRELASKWFIETQVPLIVRNGFFPTWFLGFISRKDAEEILKEKELGCFLIRLSDKAIGYILSYKGRDRCRHFVINQNESGQFVVCGDTEGHNTVSDLLENYKSSPIQPFGEYLTCSCFEELNEELYDMIQVLPKEKPEAAAGATTNSQKPHVNSEVPPTRPPKSNRTVAVQEVPPLPRRSRHLDNGEQDGVTYAQLRKHSPREKPRSQHLSQDNHPADKPGLRAERSITPDPHNVKRSAPPYRAPGTIYSELNPMEGKSRSLPLLDNGGFDGEHSYRLSVGPSTPPRLSPRPSRQSQGLTDSSSRQGSNQSLELTGDRALYSLAGRPGSPQAASSEGRSVQLSDSLYAEVPGENLSSHFAHVNTYEPLPGHEDAAAPTPNHNTYEPLEDIRPKQHQPWGVKNDKWKWLFPEVKRKW